MSRLHARCFSVMSLKAHALLSERVLLPRWQRWATYWTFALLLLTGLAWWWLDANRGDNPASSPQVALLRIHGLAAMIALMCFGALLTTHVRIAWLLKRNRVLGAMLFSAIVLLVITGYALYYAVGDGMRAASSWIHMAVGVAACVILVLHIARGRSGRRSRASRIDRTNCIGRPQGTVL
jgi:hypothetical protein